MTTQSLTPQRGQCQHCAGEKSCSRAPAFESVHGPGAETIELSFQGLDTCSRQSHRVAGLAASLWPGYQALVVWVPILTAKLLPPRTGCERALPASQQYMLLAKMLTAYVTPVKSENTQYYVGRLVAMQNASPHPCCTTTCCIHLDCNQQALASGQHTNVCSLTQSADMLYFFTKQRSQRTLSVSWRTV